MKIKNTLLLSAFFIVSHAAVSQVTVSINVSPGTMVCDNEPVTFTATVSGCPTAYEIYWKDNIFILDTTTGPVWNTTLYSGTHGIWCTVNCNPNGTANSGLINMTVDDCSGFEEYENSTLVTLYPNPSAESIAIDTEKLRMMPAMLSVFNNTGKVVKATYETKDRSVVLNVKQFADGIYYYRITDRDGKKSVTGKFVISR